MLNRKTKLYFVALFKGEEEVPVPVDMLAIYTARNEAENFLRICRQRSYMNVKTFHVIDQYEYKIIEREI